MQDNAARAAKATAPINSTTKHGFPVWKPWIVIPANIAIPMIEPMTIYAISWPDNPLPLLSSGEGGEEVLLGELPRSRLVVGGIKMLGDVDSVG
jgi:hypothetical protein